MSEITEKLTLPDTCRSDHIVVQKVTTVANLGRVPCGTSDEYRYKATSRGEEVGSGEAGSAGGPTPRG